MADSSAQRFAPPTAAIPSNAAAQIEYWKHGINVTMHFNDMCIRLRILSVSVLATFFAAAAVSMAQYPNSVIAVLWFHGHISGALYVTALIFVAAIWLLDQAYYYRMLIASVESSEAVEPKLKSFLLFEIVLGKTITERLTATIPRAASRSIANLFYGAQVLLTCMMFYWASHYQAPAALAATAPASAHSASVQLGPPSASAETPLDLRGRYAQ